MNRIPGCRQDPAKHPGNLLHRRQFLKHIVRKPKIRHHVGKIFSAEYHPARLPVISQWIVLMNHAAGHIKQCPGFRLILLSSHAYPPLSLEGEQDLMGYQSLFSDDMIFRICHANAGQIDRKSGLSRQHRINTDQWQFCHASCSPSIFPV